MASVRLSQGIMLKSAIFVNEHDGLIFRVDAPEENGSDITHYSATKLGVKKGSEFKLPNKMPLSEKCETLLNMWVGEQEWSDADIDELMPIISAMT